MSSITDELARVKLEDVDELLREVKQKTVSTEYFVDNFGNVVVPEHIDPYLAQQIRKYESDKRPGLLKRLENLEGKETAFLQSKEFVDNKGTGI